jgi:hypothetical protein
VALAFQEPLVGVQDQVVVVAAEVAVVVLPSYYKITYCKLWPVEVVAEVAAAIKAPAVIVQGRTARLMLDTTAKLEQVIHPMAVVEVVVEVDTMVAPAVEVMEAHTVVGQAPATPAAKQEILAPAGVSVILADLHPMGELLAGNRVSLYRTMWPWVGQLDVQEAMAI